MHSSFENELDLSQRMRWSTNIHRCRNWCEGERINNQFTSLLSLSLNETKKKTQTCPNQKLVPRSVIDDHLSRRNPVIHYYPNTVVLLTLMSWWSFLDINKHDCQSSRRILSASSDKKKEMNSFSRCSFCFFIVYLMIKAKKKNFRSSCMMFFLSLSQAVSNG